MKTQVELLKLQRDNFEIDTCPVSGENIKLRTKPDGRIVGIICKEYVMSKNSPAHCRIIRGGTNYICPYEEAMKR